MSASPAGPRGEPGLPGGWWWAEPGRLLVGRHPARCLAEGVDPWAVLARLGIRHLLSLVEVTEDRSLPSLPPAPNLSIRRFPVGDYGLPDPEALRALVLDLGVGPQAPPLFIHCMGGCGRSGVVAAALLVARGYCPPDRVQACLDRAREAAGLTADCPETPAQRELVGRLGALLGRL